ncbi:universal stress protein [Ferrimonas balearica]|uniref:universal stress protein n=1 Tax=Ferrimonas balearica TaxID=44012 RepID=UPI001C99D01A|nr:universal stress protein [Ferrimonas balearica]MBY5920708.1 universal stress protein [Ferrimonas balearica]MBY5996607.1 universal stress protein [Ferrimonas balearica]
MKVDEILAVTPPPECLGDSIEPAAALARLWRANLTLLYHNQRPHDVEALKEKIEELKQSEIPKVTLQGDNWERLSEVVEAMQKLVRYDLILKVMHHRSQKHTTDWHMLRATQAPLYLLNPKPHNTQARILVAMDLDHRDAAVQQLNLKVMAYAKLLAQAKEAEIHVVYAPHLSRFLHELDLISPHEVEKTATANCAEARAWLEAEGVDPANIHIKPGDTGQVVRDKSCKLKVDTLVMGYFKRSGVLSQLWRSNAERLISTLHCHLLVVPADTQ